MHIPQLVGRNRHYYLFQSQPDVHLNLHEQYVHLTKTEPLLQTVIPISRKDIKPISTWVTLSQGKWVSWIVASRTQDIEAGALP